MQGDTSAPWWLRALAAAAFFVCAYFPAKALVETTHWNAGSHTDWHSGSEINESINGSGGRHAVRTTLTRRAWLLSAMVAALLSVEGILHTLPAVLRAVWDGGGAALHALALADAARAGLVCDVFAGFCVADLLVGAVEYPSQLTLVQGVLHHAGYIAFVAILRTTGHANSFWIWAWCEIPTLLLAAAKITGRAHYRTAFDVSFVMLRVALFAPLLLAFFAHCTLAQLAWTLPCGLPILLMHCAWGAAIVRRHLPWSVPRGC
jgi:hypothetical protein